MIVTVRAHNPKTDACQCIRVRTFVTVSRHCFMCAERLVCSYIENHCYG